MAKTKVIKLTPREGEAVYFYGFESGDLLTIEKLAYALRFSMDNPESQETFERVVKALRRGKVDVEAQWVDWEGESEPMKLAEHLKDDLESLEPMLRKATDEEIAEAIPELKEMREEFSRLTTKLTDLLAIATEEKMKREFNRAGKKDDKSGATQRVRINKKGK
jgi:hypothetical protein